MNERDKILEVAKALHREMCPYREDLCPHMDKVIPQEVRLASIAWYTIEKMRNLELRTNLTMRHIDLDVIPEPEVGLCYWRGITGVACARPADHEIHDKARGGRGGWKYHEFVPKQLDTCKTVENT